MPQAGLDLRSGKSWAALVDRLSSCGGGSVYVTPGAPSASYLMNKLTGVGICTGTMMPKAGSLSAGEKALVFSWICSGAAND